MKFSWASGSIRTKGSYTGFITAAILLIFLAFSCNSHPQGRPPKGVLKEKPLVDLLVDMHYYEAVYSVTGHIGGSRPDRMHDTLDFYQPVLDRHRIGREQFVETMRYYSYDPLQFELLYNQVIDELNRLHTIAQMERSDLEPVEWQELPAAETRDLWPLRTEWVFPAAADTNKMVSFEIPVYEPGTYTFSAEIRLDPEDYSENPAVDIWFWHDDGTPGGLTEDFGRVTIIKDGISRHIIITAYLKDTFNTFIKGRVLDMSNPDGERERHAEVRNISLTRTGGRGLIRQ
jgi:hypothetical protein